MAAAGGAAGGSCRRGSSSALFLRNVFYRLVGASGGAVDQDVDPTGPPCNAATATGRKPSNWGRFYDQHKNAPDASEFAAAAREVARHRLVFFGEIHSTPSIVAFQRAVQHEMARLPDRPNRQGVDSDHAANSSDNGSKTPSPPSQPPCLHVVMEHFSFEMQDLLDEYQLGHISFDELVERYRAVGTEQHDLEPYRGLLEDAVTGGGVGDAEEEGRRQGVREIRLHAGFIPRTYARRYMKEDEPEAALAGAARWLPPGADVSRLLEGGTQDHYGIFRCLLKGSTKLVPPGSARKDGGEDHFMNKMFRAQLLKDIAMSNKINQLVALPSFGNPPPPSNNDNSDGLSKYDAAAAVDSGSDNDKILVLVGNGHVLHGCGVPERVLSEHPELVDGSCVVVSHKYRRRLDRGTSSAAAEAGEDANSRILKDLSDSFSPNAADYFYVYSDDGEPSPDGAGGAQTVSSGSAAKLETKTAYDRVGESAHYEGNLAKAVAIMRAMNYSDDQIAVAGSDAYNFQGVGNPHLHAKIRHGETVLDVGSGLGVDSFIAHHAAVVSEPLRDGASSTDGGNRDGAGFVIGIDISDKEVHHAQACASSKHQIGDRIRFAVADMEQIPLPDSCVDVVISNGAFCLAPNKEKAFAEVFRVLKPGGRMSVCTTTTLDKDKLEPGVSWPVCMQMFIPKSEIAPMCERLGFANVFVDDSDSSMSMELPQEVMSAENQGPHQDKRQRVHVGSAEFRHLENYDMDTICARVCVVARKPPILSEEEQPSNTTPYQLSS